MALGGTNYRHAFGGEDDVQRLALLPQHIVCGICRRLFRNELGSGLHSNLVVGRDGCWLR
jgi:hypothetical protein